MRNVIAEFKDKAEADEYKSNEESKRLIATKPGDVSFEVVDEYSENFNE